MAARKLDLDKVATACTPYASASKRTQEPPYGLRPKRRGAEFLIQLLGVVAILYLIPKVYEFGHALLAVMRERDRRDRWY